MDESFPRLIRASDDPAEREIDEQLIAAVHEVFLRETWPSFPALPRLVLPNFARVVATGLRVCRAEAGFGPWAFPLVAGAVRDYVIEVPVGVRDADDAVADLACEALRTGGLDAWVRLLTEQGLDVYDAHRLWFFERLAFGHGGASQGWSVEGDDVAHVTRVFQAVWVARHSRIVDEAPPPPEPEGGVVVPFRRRS